MVKEGVSDTSVVSDTSLTFPLPASLARSLLPFHHPRLSSPLASLHSPSSPSEVTLLLLPLLLRVPPAIARDGIATVVVAAVVAVVVVASVIAAGVTVVAVVGGGELVVVGRFSSSSGDLFLETLFVRPWSTSRSTWTDENTKNTVVRSVHRCCFSHFFTLFHTRSSVSNCFPGFPGSPGVSSQKVQRVSQKVRES